MKPCDECPGIELPPPAPPPSAADRLAARLVRKGDCLEWTGKRKATGYGQIQFEGKNTTTHRMAWAIWKGPIPEGMHVLHKCDNPACCNTDHLFLGTHAENMKDMVTKKRAACGEVLAAPKRGTGNPMCRISEADVAAIRTAEGTNAAIAKRFNVNPATVSNIKNRKTHSHR